MSERGPPSRGFLQFPTEGNSSIRLLYVGESPELLGSWSTTLELGACEKLKHGGHNGGIWLGSSVGRAED
jgi:hypothetical protein